MRRELFVGHSMKIGREEADLVAVGNSRAEARDAGDGLKSG
jgi:hypothetical protein